ncbi:MAG: flagellar motor switch protein FliM [Phycisphaeraceae bacterium]|nr:flagellar motor switch protein FliM [Phycisphaeraceae bacterium]
MADVLDQSAIDALLNAVDDDVVTIAPGAVKVFSRRRLDMESIEIRPYDFKRPERVSKDQMRSLQTLHEGFARNFGASLSAFLRMIVEVKLAGCEQMTYGEFVASLTIPTSFNLIDIEPLEGQICLELSPLIIYSIIDRLLGGNNEELFIPQRPQTLIEMRLIGQVIKRALDALSESWSDVAKLDFSLAETESNPQLVQIVPPNEVVIVIGFELKMVNRAGTMSLCIPYNVIEPLMEAVSAQTWFSSKGLKRTEENEKRVEATLQSAPLEVSAVLANTKITLADLANLSVGDLIVTEKPAASPQTLCVEGKRKFLCRVGQIEGSRAVRIERPIRPDDRI